MAAALLSGIVAGLGVAIPVGAIAVLIIEMGLRRGFRAGAAAGAGAATVDGAYATIAALFGGALAVAIAPWESTVRIASSVVLALIGLRLLVDARRRVVAGPATPGDERPPSLIRLYLTFVGLTGVNPLTLVYFAALIVGLPSRPEGLDEQLAFAIGAFGASFVWQMMLAALAAVGHRRLPPEVRTWTSVLGAIIVLALAGSILLDVVA
ncbi:MAG TPA: LysE family transporter [Candidatus Limnocylindrales bacterium]|nr:LysE family transporter [Candidatus Limnocylindrales bacterium]